ncbi:MAG TPA: glycosyltransferase [Chitinophagaceae bacterium]
MYKLLLIKRMIEDVFIFPFILTGRLAALISPLKKQYRIFFFFPFYHTGGAEKVHSQIANATGENDCIIFFTKRSADDRFVEDFRRSGCDIKDVSRFTGNKWFYFMNLFYRGMITGYINSQTQQPIVFNGQCNFGYKISPWIKKNIPQVELIHSLNSFSYIRIPFLPFIAKTVMISQKRIEDHKELYTRYNIPSPFLNKIVHIPNAIKLPGKISVKDDSTFTVLYVGRGTEEKRVGLVAETAKRLVEKKENVEFEIMGDISGSLNRSSYPFIKFYENISEENRIHDIYAKAHVLMLTSSTEGFPMVIMEAMAYGCVILSTAVGDIPYHVKNNENGFLFSNTENGSTIINEATEKIISLKNNRRVTNQMSENNFSYANHNFGIERFNKNYQDLFSSVKSRFETT